MANSFIVIGIGLFLAYVIYDQFLMDRLKGKTHLTVKLQRQARLDGAIFIVFLLLLGYHGVQHQISSFTLYLLCACVLLTVYGAFWRAPRLLLKAQGFFFGNLYFRYQDVQKIIIATDPKFPHSLFFEMQNGKRLIVRAEDVAARAQIIHALGGKTTTH